MKPTVTIEKAQEFHKAGQLREAKEAYLELLKINPSDVKALHLLGIVYAEEGDLDAACSVISQAIILEPNDLTLSLHLANILKSKGLFTEAMQILLNLIEHHPHFAAAINNLGTVYFAEEKWSEAIEAFKQAIAIQSNYVDAYYNLALSLHKAKRLNEAKMAYQALLELQPLHMGGVFQLGCIYMQFNQYHLALDCFVKVLKEQPANVETKVNLATCYLQLGHLDMAKDYYLKALQQNPSDSQIFFNLGVIALKQGQIAEGIDYYLEALKFDPDFYDAHNNLGVAFLKLNDIHHALEHFREALRIKPTDEAISHTINVLTQNKNIVSSPKAYISSLFDSYADYYDFHLSKTLHYQIPQLFYTAVQEVRDINHSKWDILDLGCGTGLCGELFTSVARTLVGVDLSEGMLVKAKQKNIYSELVQADIIDFLLNKDKKFDFIIAGDVLVYYGDLSRIIELVHQALKPKGLFIFNLEFTHKNNYEITQSGRFVHNIKYIEQLAYKYHFKILQSRFVNMRTQKNEEVTGLLYLLEKMD